MQVDAAVFGDGEDLRRQNPPVGHHHDQVGGQLADDLFALPVPQGAGLPHRQAVDQSHLLHRRRRQDLMAVYRLILPGEHPAQGVGAGAQGLQAVGRDVRRAHKQDLHHRSTRPDP